jgi:hypothetical protein
MDPAPPQIVEFLTARFMASNLAFADDGRTLYITAQTTLYRTHLLFPGENCRSTAITTPAYAT